MGRPFFIRFFSTLIPLFVLTLSLFAFAEDSWKPFISKEGGFSVLIPGIPTFKKASHKSFVGTVEENTFQVKWGDENFMVEYSDIPKTALFLGGSDTLFDETREALLNDMRGVQLQFASATLQGNPAKLLTFKILPQGKESVEKIGKAKLILIHQRLYLLVAVIPRTSVSNHPDLFLESFQKL